MDSGRRYRVTPTTVGGDRAVQGAGHGDGPHRDDAHRDDAHREEAHRDEAFQGDADPESPRGAGLSAAIRRAAWRYVPPSQIARWLGVAALVVVVSACWGVATASTEANLGPHLARYDVTVDGKVTVDLGPLGALVIDSPLPLTLGVQVTVLEIPSEVTAVDRVSTLEALGSDLDQYVQFFTGPQATLQVVLRDLIVDATARTVFAVLVLGGGVLLVRAALGDRRRREIATSLRPYRRTIAGSAAMVVLVATTVTSGVPASERLSGAQSASAVFDGTPLEGARITGRLAGVIDTYGGYLIDAYRESEAFYAQVTAELRDEWADQAAADRVFAALQRERASRIDEATGAGADAGASADGAAEDPGLGDVAGDADGDGDGDAAEGEPGPEPGALPGAVPGTQGGGRGPGGVDLTGSTVVGAANEATEPVVALVISDLHCNVGMAPVIGELAELAQVDVVLNAGDTTVNGTAVEAYCVNAFISALPAGVPMVVADGNHDSRLTAAQEQAAGAIVLDGAPVDVAGIRILGDGDPNETRIGAGTVTVEGETRTGWTSCSCTRPRSVRRRSKRGACRRRSLGTCIDVRGLSRSARGSGTSAAAPPAPPWHSRRSVGCGGRRR